MKLEPAPAWVHWDHSEAGTWPAPDDLAVDLNAHAGPGWLEAIGERVSRRLLRCRLPPVVGHVDWESHNLAWRNGKPVAVHDWDSVAARPEAAVAGAAGAVFASLGPVIAATADQTQTFLDAYCKERDRAWSTEELEVAWAAGLWVLAYNAKKESLAAESGPYLAQVSMEAEARLLKAGA